MDNPFLRALFVQPPVVLGVQLKPYSAYHMAAMMLLDSPMSPTSPGEITIDDLAMGVFICSHGVEDGPPLLFPELDMVAFAECCRDPKSRDMDIEGTLFVSYMMDYLKFPLIWTEEGKGKESGMPVPFHLVATVLQAYGSITREQAWDMPINELVCYKCGVAENNGLEVMSEAQRLNVELAERLGREAAEQRERQANG